ncbi:MAG: rhomboid family intramembrane serine protease [bacterium]|nr:rhomboid family intramembrane serine protease [bacterium]
MFPLRTDINSKSFPFFTYFLILGNIFLFIYSFFMPGGFETVLRKYGCIPNELIYGKDIAPYIDFPVYLTSITSMFFHASWMHLLGNMLFLFVFGKNIEDWFGHWKFLGFYIGCGIAACIVQILLSPLSKIPMVGASGAIAGVMGAYFLLYPSSRVSTWIPVFWVIEIPAFLWLGIWIIEQIVSSMGGPGGSPIAFFAHIGGFFVGLFWVKKLRGKKTGGWK